MDVCYTIHYLYIKYVHAHKDICCLILVCAQGSDFDLFSSGMVRIRTQIIQEPSLQQTECLLMYGNHSACLIWIVHQHREVIFQPLCFLHIINLLYVWHFKEYL